MIRIFNIAYLLLFAAVVTASAQTTGICFLSVEELLNLGCKNSLQIMGREVELKIAGTNYINQKTYNLPEISVGAMAGYSGNPAIFPKNTPQQPHSLALNWNQNYNVEAIQTIYAGRWVKNSTDKAELQKQIAQLFVERDISQLKLLLIDKYLDILRLQKQRELISVSISQAELRLHDILVMERNGMVTKSDVLRTELQLSNYNLTLKEVQNNIKIASTQLDIALGLDEEQIIVADSSLLESLISIMPFANYIDEAYNNYPELKISQSNITIAQKESQIIKSDFMPKLSAYASNVLARPISMVSPAQDLYANNWNVGLKISYNLSSLYHNKQKVVAAKQNISLVSIEQQKVMQQIRNNIKASYIKHNEALERVSILIKSVEQSNENYRIVLNKYQNRMAILTDLLDASTLQLDAQLLLTEAKTTAVHTYYQLLRDSGTL